MEKMSLLCSQPDPVLSAMVVYCLFETYGFPLEYVVDEVKRNYHMDVDEKKVSASWSK